MVKCLGLLARRQGLHVEGIIGVLGGSAEPLGKQIRKEKWVRNSV